MDSTFCKSLAGRLKLAVCALPVRLLTLYTVGALSLALAACAVPVVRTSSVDGPGTPMAVGPTVQYGTVERIDLVETTMQPTGGGTALGALIGGVIGNRFGGGSGRAAATALGAVGGAVLGTNAECQQAAAGSAAVYRVVIDLDDGSRRSFDYSTLNGLHAGERVRLQDGLVYRA